MVRSNGDIKLVDYDNCRHIVSKQGDVVDCIGTPEFTGKNKLSISTGIPTCRLFRLSSEASPTI